MMSVGMDFAMRNVSSPEGLREVLRHGCGPRNTIRTTCLITRFSQNICSVVLALNNLIFQSPENRLLVLENTVVTILLQVGLPLIVRRWCRGTELHSFGAPLIR